MFNALLFFGTYIAGFISALTLNPAFAFVIYEAVYFFNPQQRWWGYIVPDISYSFYTVVLMLVVYLFKFSDHNKNKLTENPLFKWLYILVTIYTVSYFWAVAPEQHLNASILFIKVIFIITVAYKICDTDKKLTYILYGYIFGAAYISLVVQQTGRNRGGRVEGIGTVDSPDANGLAATIVPSLVLCLYYIWVTNNKWSKLILTFSGALIVNAIILINSRGAFLAIATSIAYFMYWMYRSQYQRPHQKTFATWLIVFGLAGLLYLADDSFLNRVQSISNTDITEEQESATTRILFWRAAWNMSIDHPAGNGFQGFNYYSPDYIPTYIDTGASRNRSVHSTWLEVLTEIGYLGLLVFIILLISCFKLTIKCKTVLGKKGDLDNYYKIIALESSLIAFIIAMSFMNRFRAEILYWCILYIACAYNIYVLKYTTTREGTNEHQ